jgi:hypothetical protein
MESTKNDFPSEYNFILFSIFAWTLAGIPGLSVLYVQPLDCQDDSLLFTTEALPIGSELSFARHRYKIEI